MANEMSEALQAMEANEPQANLYRAAEEYVSDLTRELVGIGDSDDFDILVTLMKQAVLYGAHWMERHIKNKAVDCVGWYDLEGMEHQMLGVGIHSKDIPKAIKPYDRIKVIIFKRNEND